MTTQFPVALDSFTNPTALDTLNSATVPHADQHANANDAIEALQAKVGINGSADTQSIDYRLAVVESASDPDVLLGKTDKTGISVDSVGAYTSTLTYNETTRTITISPTGASFDVFIQGARYSKGAQSLSHPSADGGHFFYFNEAGDFVTGTSPWNLLRHAPVAFVFWDATNSRGVAFDERHHAGRDVYWHRNQHTAEGTKATSGFAATGYTLNDGSTDAAVTFSIASGRVEDEDIRVDTQALPDAGPYTILERVGADGHWEITRSAVRPFLDSGTALQYNQNNAGTWQRATLTEDYFVNYWVFATTSLPTTDYTPSPTTTQQIVIVSGQSIYSTESAAHAETVGNLSWGAVPFQEIVPLYQVTLRYNASNPAAYANTAKCAITRMSRVIGTSASITQTAQTDHGALAGLSDDDHLQYGMANPLAVAVTYNASGTTTISLDGGRTDLFYATAATGATTWVFSGSATSGKVSRFDLELTNGGSQTQTWPASVKWDNGTPPTLTAAGLDILTFYTRDGGATWRGFLAAKDSK